MLFTGLSGNAFVAFVFCVFLSHLNFDMNFDLYVLDLHF